MTELTQSTAAQQEHVLGDTHRVQQVEEGDQVLCIVAVLRHLKPRAELERVPQDLDLAQLLDLRQAACQAALTVHTECALSCPSPRQGLLPLQSQPVICKQLGAWRCSTSVPARL